MNKCIEYYNGRVDLYDERYSISIPQYYTSCLELWQKAMWSGSNDNEGHEKTLAGLLPPWWKMVVG